MTDLITAIILAAGKGTRMRSSLHKVLHPVAGKPLLHHVLAATQEIKAQQTIVVVGAGREQVEASIKDMPGVTTALQAEQNGTGHAVQCAQDALAHSDGIVVILYGDVPFVSPDTITAVCARAGDTGGLAVLGFEAADPGAYGRLICGDGDALSKIVEFKDANAAERAVSLCNSGILAAPLGLLFELLSQVKSDNAAGEYYLTDVVGIAAARGLPAHVITADEAEVQGVNSRSDLAAANAAVQARIRAAMMEDGVTLEAPETVFFCTDTIIENDVTIEPNVVFGPGVTVKTGARIKAFSHLEGCTVEGGASVGPYARLRPGAHLGKDVKVGNFVEIKKATLDTGAKASHLTYIGDAHVGAGANIGAGTITCNYDGYFKHKTEIGAGAFIGSNTALVAPVTVGAGVIVAAGSTITKDVAAGALGVARAKQEDDKPGWAERFNTIMAKRKNVQKRAEQKNDK